MKLLVPITRVFGRVVHRGESFIRPVGKARNGSLPRPNIALIAAMGVLLLLWSAGVGLAQAVDTTLWVASGALSPGAGGNAPVRSVVSDGGTIYIGGDFTLVGPATGGAVAIDASTAFAQQPYPRVLGYVNAVAPDGSGGWYLGGTFTAVRGQPRTNLAHLDASGNVTSWNPTANAQVYALAVSGGTVYAVGIFTSIGGKSRNYIAALDAATGAATKWNPSPNAYAISLAVSGGTVYVGGAFTSIGGQPRNYIAALDAATGAATAWNPNPGGGAFGTGVYAIAVSGGTIYVGGYFTRMGTQVLIRNRIAALDAATGAATSFDPNANDGVHALAVSGGTVYAAGGFISIGGQARNHIAALNAASGAATAWNPNASTDYGNGVWALALSGGTVYAGGTFSNIGGQSRSNIAALNAATGAATAWNPVASLTVGALAVSGGTVYAGGGFTSIGAQPRNYIAALDAATGALTAWNPNPNARVFALAVSGGTVYAGGQFTSIGGQPRNRITALDAASGTATAWDPNADNDVSALAVSGATVYAGGRFASIGGQPRNRIAALDAASGTATAWDPNANNDVSALALSGGTVYAGGSFTSIGGQPRSRIAALDAASGTAIAWDPNANNDVRALAVSGGTVYAGGKFTSIGGQTRNRIAALSAASAAASAWDPNAYLNFYDPFNPDPVVYALAVTGSTVYAGGYFTNVGGELRNRIAGLDVATGAATAWDPEANDDVYALAVSGGTVYAGGKFTSVGVQPQSGIAAITDGSLVSVGDDPSITEGLLTVAPNPTRAGTQIGYSVVRSGRVRLELLDVSGRVEATLDDRFQEPGRYVATWDGVGRGGRLSPGLHFLRLVAADRVMLRKLVIIR
jgi:urease beta subunit